MSGAHAPSDLVAPALVQILDDRGEHRGFGLLVTDGRVVTCAHVVALAWDEPDTLEEPLDRPVTVVFPFVADDALITATVAAWVPMAGDGTGDVAGLVLTDAAPDGVRPVRMARGGTVHGHDMLVYGYQGERSVPAWVPATAVDRTQQGWIQLGEGATTAGLRIRRGYSGSPLWDVQTGQVVGLVHRASRSREVWLAYGLDAGQILAAWPELLESFDRSCPYRKLVPFEASDSRLFFGRTEETRAVVRAVNRTSMCLVTGASGVGKTSLLRATVLPELERRGFGVVTLRPLDRDSLWDCVAQAVPGLPAGFQAESVGTRLTRVGEAVGRDRIVLIVDQFEELLHREPRRAVEFAQDLWRLTQERHRQGGAVARVVLVVRENARDAVAGLPGNPLVIDELVEIGPLDADRLIDVIVQPARLTGVRFEDRLVDRIVDDVRYQPYALQVLQIHLAHLWEYLGEDDELRLRDYEEVVRTGGTLTTHLDTVWAGLAPDERRAAEELFFHLAVPLDSGTYARRTAARDELDPATWEVAGVLATLSFVVLRGQGTDATVELAHDSLIDQWPTLSDLLTTHRDLLVWRTEVRGRIRAWDHAGRPARQLLTGVPLRQGAALRPRLSVRERDFVTASTRRRSRMLRGTAILAVLLLLVVGGAVRAYDDQRHQTRKQTDLASARRLAARSGDLADTDPALARLLAVAAWRVAPVAEARLAMVRALGNPWRTTLRGHQAAVRSLAFTPDGARLITGADDRTVRLWDVAGARPLGGPLPDKTGSALAVAVSPDGRTLATSESGQSVRLWDAATGRSLTVAPPGRPPYPNGSLLEGHSAPVLGIAFSPDGNTLATASEDRTVRLWDVAAHRPLGPPLTGFREPVRTVTFAPDGRTLVTGDRDGTLAFWRTSDRRRLGTLAFGRSAEIYAVAFQKDGDELFTARFDGEITLVNVRSRTARRTWPVPGSAPVLALAIDPARHLLISGSADGAIRLWDTDTSAPIGAAMTGHEGPVQALAVAPDGRTLASGSSDATVRLWNLPDQHVPKPSPWPGGNVNALAFAPGARTLAVAGRNTAVGLIDLPTGHSTGRPPGRLNAVALAAAFNPAGTVLSVVDAAGVLHTWDSALRPGTVTLAGFPRKQGRTSAAFSRDTRMVATGHEDGVIRLWDTATGRLVSELHGHVPGYFVYGVAFSPDGRYLASADVDGTARLWDVATRRRLGGPMADLIDGAYAVAFGPDSRTLAVGVGDGSVRFWEVPGLRRLGPTVRAHGGAVWSLAFSPDGLMTASAGTDGRIWIWDRTTRLPLTGPFAVPRPTLPVLTFDPTSHLLAVGDQSSVRLWDVSTYTDLPGRLCTAAGRSLTPTEWHRFLPAGSPYRPTCPSTP